jgi:hypothetical protein
MSDKSELPPFKEFDVNKWVNCIVCLLSLFYKIFNNINNISDNTSNTYLNELNLTFISPELLPHIKSHLDDAIIYVKNITAENFNNTIIEDDEFLNDLEFKYNETAYNNTYNDVITKIFIDGNTDVNVNNIAAVYLIAIHIIYKVNDIFTTTNSILSTILVNIKTELLLKGDIDLINNIITLIKNHPYYSI